jgi:outer membrane lipoprotein SlyB
MTKPMTLPALILLSALALTGCAAPDVNRSAVNFNESQFSVDLNLCRGGSIAEASLKTFGKGALSSLAGAGVVALHGAVAAGSGEAIVAGAIVGACLRPVVGSNRHHLITFLAKARCDLLIVLLDGVICSDGARAPVSMA